MAIQTDIYQRIVAAKVYMDDNFMEPMDLAQISRHACLSRFHFHRLFRQVYKKTPHQYLTQKRMQKAKDLLGENKAIAEVCMELGYESTGSFSLLFRKEIGFAPQFYRNMALQKKKEQMEQPRKAIPHCFIEQYMTR